MQLLDCPDDPSKGSLLSLGFLSNMGWQPSIVEMHFATTTRFEPIQKHPHAPTQPEEKWILWQEDSGWHPLSKSKRSLVFTLLFFLPFISFCSSEDHTQHVVFSLLLCHAGRKRESRSQAQYFPKERRKKVKNIYRLQVDKLLWKEVNNLLQQLTVGLCRLWPTLKKKKKKKKIKRHKRIEFKRKKSPLFPPCRSATSIANLPLSARDGLEGSGIN